MNLFTFRVHPRRQERGELEVKSANIVYEKLRVRVGQKDV